MITKNTNGHFKQKARVGLFITNSIIATLFYFFITGTVSPFGSPQGLWLLAIITYWLFTLLTTPFVTPPKDTFANATSTLLLLGPTSLVSVVYYQNIVMFFYWLTLGLSSVIAMFALIAIFKKDSPKKTSLGVVSYQLSSLFGRGDMLFTLVTLVCVLGFYQGDMDKALLVMGFWVMMIVIKPVEILLKIYKVLKKEKITSENKPIGSIARIDDPSIAKVSLANSSVSWKKGDLYTTVLANGKKAYILPLFAHIQNESVIGTGLIYQTELEMAVDSCIGVVYENTEVDALEKGVLDEGLAKKVTGLVSESSTIGNIRFEVVKGVELEDGMVVFCNINNKRVYYQILDAKTEEEDFQSSPYGKHIVSASQLGHFSKEQGFQKFSWLPEMNQPVFLVGMEDVLDQKIEKGFFSIGKIPSTGFEVPVEISTLVEYHTAILGVTGTGKTELALDIIRNALEVGTKVFCVDFTGEYAPRLKDLEPEIIGLSESNIKNLEDSLHAVSVGEFGAKKERANLQVFLNKIEPDIEKQIDHFLMDEEKHLGIFALSEITNTKASLRLTEMYLSSIMKWAKENRKARRVLIVLEEAHTIIPEVYSSGFDADTQWVVGRIGQIALQGRKYGVGLLIMSQRTALVSKTILSQCNTYFTHGLIDKTSLDYLAGVYSSEHVKSIPNLRSREFIASGKAIKSERPLLIRADFDQSKLNASKALDTTFKKVQEDRIKSSTVYRDNLGF